MLAIVYLFVLFLLGDAVGRRYLPFASLAHRLASAFVIGLLLSSWSTYTLAYLFGKFIRQIAVPVWEKAYGNYPDIAYDKASKTIYVSSGKSNEVLAFKTRRNPLTGLKPDGDARLFNPSSLAISVNSKPRRLLVMDTEKSALRVIELDTSRTK